MNPQFREYLVQHNVPALVEDLVRTLCVTRPKHPKEKIVERLRQIQSSGGIRNIGKAGALEKRSGEISDEITIIHFNDVYNIEPRTQEPVGGAARFVTMVKSFANRKPLVLFSGDAFNPSIMSTITKGKQMPPVLNAIGPEVSTVGNHDFDFGVETMEALMKECKFPWMLSNVFIPGTSTPLAGCKLFHIVEWQGHRIGCIGLVEREWLVTLATISEEDVEYVDFVEEGRRLARMLKEQMGCQLVIAITHMRVPNDNLLAFEVPEVDLILGGHDHHYEVRRVGAHGTWVLKSGTDFRDATVLTVKFGENAERATLNDPETGTTEKQGNFHISVERIEVTSKYAEDPEVAKVVGKYMEVVGAKMEQVIGETAVELDARFQSIRTMETNVSNLVADILRRSAKADVCILNSGTLRADCIMPKGPFKLKDLVALLPMLDTVAVIEISGAQLLQAFENGVSQWPRLEGRFPCLSGARFEFDPTQPAGERVVRSTVKVDEHALDLKRNYRLVTKEYLAQGKDGYDVFKDCKVLVSGEALPAIPTMVRHHFMLLSVLNKFNKGGHYDQHEASNLQQLALETGRRASFSSLAQLVSDLTQWMVAPTIEGRIVNLHPPK
eukprot:TRINITY_DN146_c0_g1_i3.p1 TRINITY_DN146_c0_g1~~TRINITY_DN146_c0_g1_i3.p1  ORF type:complete len:611 (-),score=130.21 TRINITY_DN146_c0_g1_i3:160-1992(-)